MDPVLAELQEARRRYFAAYKQAILDRLSAKDPTSHEDARYRIYKAFGAMEATDLCIDAYLRGQMVPERKGVA